MGLQAGFKSSDVVGLRGWSAALAAALLLWLAKVLYSGFRIRMKFRSMKNQGLVSECLPTNNPPPPAPSKCLSQGRVASNPVVNLITAGHPASLFTLWSFAIDEEYQRLFPF